MRDSPAMLRALSRPGEAFAEPADEDQISGIV